MELLFSPRLHYLSVCVPHPETLEHCWILPLKNLARVGANINCCYHVENSLQEHYESPWSPGRPLLRLHPWWKHLRSHPLSSRDCIKQRANENVKTGWLMQRNQKKLIVEIKLVPLQNSQGAIAIILDRIIICCDIIILRLRKLSQSVSRTIIYNNSNNWLNCLNHYLAIDIFHYIITFYWHIRTN